MENQATLYRQVNRGQMENGDALLKYAAAKLGDVVLDIGCGTGELTYRLAESVGSTGKVVAIDPDSQRLQIAQQHMPNELQNITWINDRFVSDAIEPKPTFDLVFSNFVLHWIEDDADKKVAVKLLHDCLKEGGRFAVQFVYGLTEIQNMVSDFVNRPMYFTSNLRELWLSYFDEIGLKYEIKEDVTPYYHPDLDDFLAWYEATTHGVADRSKLTDKHMQILRNKYPGEIYVNHLTLRLVGFKSMPEK